MKKYGFLFGAGAEIAYNLPSGGQFALDIFRQDPAEPKQMFRKMRDNVDSTTSYANDWLPEKYKDKNISAFGKTVFENIISSTVEHNRKLVIEKVNTFDETALFVISRMDGIDVNGAFQSILEREVSNTKLSQDIAYNENFKNGNQLFESNYLNFPIFAWRYQGQDPNDDRGDRNISKRAGGKTGDGRRDLEPVYDWQDNQILR